LLNVIFSGKNFGGKFIASSFGLKDVENTHRRGNNVMNKKIAINPYIKARSVKNQILLIAALLLKVIFFLCMSSIFEEV
jgi:hypothetical protein